MVLLQLKTLWNKSRLSVCNCDSVCMTDSQGISGDVTFGNTTIVFVSSQESMRGIKGGSIHVYNVLDANIGCIILAISASSVGLLSRIKLTRLPASRLVPPNTLYEVPKLPTFKSQV